MRRKSHITRICVAMDTNIEEQIETVLDKVRPFLYRDGGDVELIGFKDGIVYLKMKGACEGCSYALDDIASGVEIILCEEVPGVIGVSASGDIPDDIKEAYLARKESKDAEEEAKKEAERREIELAKKGI